MGHGYARRIGVWAKVWLLLGLVARIARAEAPIELAETKTEPGVVVYRAEGSGPHGITVLLHGMCGEPVNACRHFAPQVTIDQHLICPRASQRCDGGGATWPQRGFEQEIEAAVQRALTVHGPSVDEAGGRTLIGYSLGAFRALELAEHRAGKYPRVMLIGAKISAQPQRLRQSGVQRLLLSAGLGT